MRSPDPAFQVNADPDPDPNSVLIQGCDDQKLKKKFYSLKKIDIFLIKIAIYGTYPQKNIQATEASAPKTKHPQTDPCRSGSETLVKRK
jgi:hypothetical protein